MRPIVPPEINRPHPGAPLLVGRDPGSEESAAGTPFIGMSGKLLFGGFDPISKKWIEGAVANAGLERKDFNITNRVLRQPWNNDFYRHDWQDIKQGGVELRSLVEQLQPSVIIATGAQAAYDLIPGWATLTDKHPGDYSGGRDIKGAKEILDRRGFFWYPEDATGLPCPVLATLHPAACLYQPMPNRLMLDLDFSRLGAVLRGDLPRQSWPELKRVRVAGDMEAIWRSELVAYDIEIKWGGAELLCVAFYTAEGQGFLAYADALHACSDWLRSDRPKLCHNGQFDRYFLESRYGLRPGGRHEDTILGHWAQYPELAGKSDTGREDQKKKTKHEMTRKGLNFLASMHLNVPWWKTYTSDPTLMGRLCVNDVAATMWCWEIMEPEIDQLGVRTQYERQVAKIPALIAVQRKGLRIDEEMRQARLAELGARQKAKELESKLAAEAFLKAHKLTHDPDGKEYIWYHAGRCECCGGGKKIAAHCHRCLRFPLKDTKKPTLVDYVLRNHPELTNKEGIKKSKVSALLSLLPPCRICGGSGKVDTWDFNPMSSAQMPLLLAILEVPKKFGTDASEETLRDVLEWAEDR